jgi:hypothetical protein
VAQIKRLVLALILASTAAGRSVGDRGIRPSMVGDDHLLRR